MPTLSRCVCYQWCIQTLLSVSLIVRYYYSFTKVAAQEHRVFKKTWNICTVSLAEHWTVIIRGGLPSAQRTALKRKGPQGLCSLQLKPFSHWPWCWHSFLADLLLGRPSHRSGPTAFLLGFPQAPEDSWKKQAIIRTYFLLWVKKWFNI